MKSKKYLLIRLIAGLGICCGCERTEGPIANFYVEDGCIPSDIHCDDDSLGQSTNYFNYSNSKLLESTGPDIYTYYRSGLVERISIGAVDANRYEKYTYDDKKRIVRSEQFSRDKSNEDFKIVLDIKYIYDGDIVIKATDNIQGKYYELFYQNNSKNIDSLKTFKLNGQLIEKEFFEYDNFNNIYKNLRTPKFDYFWNLKKHTSNNIMKQVLIKLNQPTDSIIFTETYKYNNFGFPIEVKSTWNKSSLSSVKSISYSNCK